MAIVYADRVKEQTTTAGTGTLSLGGAFTGFQTFSAGVGSGNETYYTIVDDTTNEWEVGVGTVGIGSLSRDTILDSSNAGLHVNFAAGSKTVFATVAAQFFDLSLSAGEHASVDHTGFPGVPAAETFDAVAHAGTDHTAVPLSLLNTAAHSALDHTGIPGVGGSETFTASVHEAVDHTAAPFNLLDEPAHDALDHTGLTGVVSTPTRSYTIEMVTPGFGVGPAPGGPTVFWVPGFANTVGFALTSSQNLYPVPTAGRVVAAAINNASGSGTVSVLVNGISVFSFFASGVGTVAVVPGWVAFPIVAGNFISVETATGVSHEAALVMFIEP